MAKQITIKEIAERAGVSVGTVDRILHNRGKVSDKSRVKVEQILSSEGFKFNIHSSAIALKKTFRISFCFPIANYGDYWSSINDGVTYALSEYSDVSLECDNVSYNQLDIRSFRDACEQILQSYPDGVLIGPTFGSETGKFCAELDKRGIPYVFVDSLTAGTNPVASVTSDQRALARTLGCLIVQGLSNERKVAIFHIKRKGGISSTNTQMRGQYLKEYFTEKGLSDRILESTVDTTTAEQCKLDVLDFLGSHPEVNTVCMLNSKSFILSSIIKSAGLKNLRVYGFDMTDRNRNCLSEGQIAALVCQKPEMQGFFATSELISYLVYRQKKEMSTRLTPVDIIVKENLDIYQDFIKF